MKTTKGFVVVLVILSSLPMLAQQAGANVQQSASGTANGSQVSQSAAANAIAQRNKNGVQAQVAGSASGSGAAKGVSANSSGAGSASSSTTTPVNGELANKLDAKSAKPGDPVVLKTTDKTRTADGMVIPKGSRLVGHVTDVQAHGKGNDDSHIGIQFDRAELKGGQTVPIHSVIQSVAPAPQLASAAMENEDSLEGGGMGGGLRGGGGGRVSGGGLTGGGGLASASSLGGGARTLGGSANAVGSGIAGAGNGTIGSASRLTGSAAAGTSGDVRGAAAGGGALAAHATAIPGVMLAGDATGAASGTLSASRKNLHLDSGTQMVIGVSSAVSK